MHSRSKGITVTGTGVATAPPDLVTVDIAVTALADTVAGASQQAATAARGVLDAVISSGIDRKAITTTTYSISSEYDWQSGSTRRFLGYRVVNNLSVEVRDVDGVGTVIDHAVHAAGDAAEVNGLRFSIDDPTDLERQARDLAWSDAVAVAAQLASLAGRALGRATAITEVTGGPAPFPVRRAEMAAADMTTPIEGGTTTVQVTVQARFEFAD